MKDSILAFVSDSDREKIIKAVEDAEKTTSGEIAPMIVPYSHTYPMANFRGAFLFSIIAALSVSLVLKNESIRLFLPVFLFCMIAFYFLIERAVFLKRFFTFASEMDDEVSGGALASFYENGLHKTREENGVLIFISVFERKVWILADRGVNEKIDHSEWEKIIADLTSGIKKGNQCGAIVSAVDAVGAVLREKFPYREDDTNELDNLIIKTK